MQEYFTATATGATKQLYNDGGAETKSTEHLNSSIEKNSYLNVRISRFGHFVLHEIEY